MKWPNSPLICRNNTCKAQYVYIILLLLNIATQKGLQVIPVLF